ncbi:hypothetical protein Q1695_015197 [Nippostrongylus brasiliensis]|nr:hypothetical protein Q1695_015197 [Nippostrongylus brasiliensis]
MKIMRKQNRKEKNMMSLCTRDVLVDRQVNALLMEKQMLERKIINEKEWLKTLKVDEVSLEFENERAKVAKWREARSKTPIHHAQEKLRAWITFRLRETIPVNDPPTQECTSFVRTAKEKLIICKVVREERNGPS